MNFHGFNNTPIINFETFKVEYKTETIEALLNEFCDPPQLKSLKNFFSAKRKRVEKRWKITLNHPPVASPSTSCRSRIAAHYSDSLSVKLENFINAKLSFTFEAHYEVFVCLFVCEKGEWLSNSLSESFEALAELFAWTFERLIDFETCDEIGAYPNNRFTFNPEIFGISVTQVDGLEECAEIIV